MQRHGAAIRRTPACAASTALDQEGVAGTEAARECRPAIGPASAVGCRAGASGRQPGPLRGHPTWHLGHTRWNGRAQWLRWLGDPAASWLKAAPYGQATSPPHAGPLSRPGSYRSSGPFSGPSRLRPIPVAPHPLVTAGHGPDATRYQHCSAWPTDAAGARRFRRRRQRPPDLGPGQPSGTASP
jgi:hypothetical protein